MTYLAIALLFMQVTEDLLTCHPFSPQGCLLRWDSHPLCFQVNGQFSNKYATNVTRWAEADINRHSLYYFRRRLKFTIYPRIQFMKTGVSMSSKSTSLWPIKEPQNSSHLSMTLSVWNFLFNFAEFIFWHSIPVTLLITYLFLTFYPKVQHFQLFLMGLRPFWACAEVTWL